MGKVGWLGAGPWQHPKGQAPDKGRRQNGVSSAQHSQGHAEGRARSQNRELETQDPGTRGAERGEPGGTIMCSRPMMVSAGAGSSGLGLLGLLT